MNEQSTIEIRRRMDRAFAYLRSTDTDFFLDANQIFPPTGGGTSEYGPIHQSYSNLVAFGRRSGREDPEYLRRALDETIAVAEHYKDLLAAFSRDNPVFVTVDIADTITDLRYKMIRIAGKYRQEQTESMDRGLWLRMFDFMDYQIRYVEWIMSGVVTEKTTDLRSMRSFGYNFWDDVRSLAGFLTFVDEQKSQQNKAAANLVSIAVANSIRRGRPSRILSSTRKLTEYLGRISQKNVLMPVLLRGSKHMLSSESSGVSVCRMGVKGDILTDSDTANNVGSHEFEPRYKKSGNGDSGRCKRHVGDNRPDQPYYGRGGFGQGVL